MTSPYDKYPEGHGCFQKMMYLSKYGAKAAVCISVYDILLYSHPKGFGPTIARIVVWGSRCIIPLASFAALACAASSLRPGKEDYWNYTISGGIAGAIAGALTQSTKRAIGWGFFGAFVGHMFKDSLVYDYKWIIGEPYNGERFFDRTLYIKKRSEQSLETDPR